MKPFQFITRILNKRANAKLLGSLPDSPVETFSASSGNVLRTFNSPRSVLAAGYPDALAVLGRDCDMTYGVRWRFQDSEPEEVQGECQRGQPARPRGRRREFICHDQSKPLIRSLARSFTDSIMSLPPARRDSHPQ